MFHETLEGHGAGGAVVPAGPRTAQLMHQAHLNIQTCALEGDFCKDTHQDLLKAKNDTFFASLKQPQKQSLNLVVHTLPYFAG